MNQCTIDFAFLEKGMAESEVSNEVIGPKRQCLFVMDDRVIDSFFLEKGIPESNPGIRIVWLVCDSFLAIGNRFVDLAFA